MHPKSKVMNYREKIKIAEQGVKYLKDGRTLKDYKNQLKKDGFYNYDINNIVFSIKNILWEKYGNEFKTLLETEQLDSKRENYSFLDDEIFDFIKEKEINSIISAKNVKSGNFCMKDTLILKLLKPYNINISLWKMLFHILKNINPEMK